MRRLSLALVVFLLTGCGTDAGEGATTTAGPDTTTMPVPTTTSTSAGGSDDTTPTGEEAEMELIEMAVADLSTRLDVSADDIETVSIESGVWSDGSIGCPEPNQFYTQALVPGHRVILAHDGQTYCYHQGGSQPPFLCEDPVEEAFTGTESDALIPPPGYDD